MMNQKVQQPLPQAQHANPFDTLPDIPLAQLHERRERVFLILAGLFLGTLAMLNILGITRFIKLAETSSELSFMAEAIPDSVLFVSSMVMVVGLLLPTCKVNSPFAIAVDELLSPCEAIC